MSDTQQVPAVPVDDRLDALRRESAWRLDPVRFRYLEAMARRLASQPAPVRRLLQAKLERALDDYAGRFEAARAATPGLRPAPRPATRAASRPVAAAVSCQPLAQLNAYLREASQGAAPATPQAARPGATEPAEGAELSSVRRFRQAWTRQRAQAQVAPAATRKPANAGPLNSHALALQSLALMQSLSPDYLRRFMLQVESLQWLEQAGWQYPATPAKGGKAAKGGKGAKAGAAPGATRRARTRK